MRILSIETSCDETALSIIETGGPASKPAFKILANNVASQIDIHRQYGGVYPMMAKREHGRNMIPLFEKTLKEASLLKLKRTLPNVDQIKKLLEREPELLARFLKFMPGIAKPKIDLIAVTSGPGLEPALWVGINFAKALSEVWGIPVLPVNHMEGHIFSVIVPAKGKVAGLKFSLENIKFPALALLVSGGHTELILIKDWLQYKKIGQTKDDAAGEAFDKVARILGLPYPGGPEISKLAAKARNSGHSMSAIKLPRPMIKSPDFDFSFSGLKTAALYLTQKLGRLTPKLRMEVAREFEDAAVEVLAAKTFRAAEKYKIKTLIVGGGVAANRQLRKVFEQNAEELKIPLHFPRPELATDNSLMIAITAYFRFRKNKKIPRINLKAEGNLQF